MLDSLLDTQPSTFNNASSYYAFGTMHATPPIYALLPPYAITYFGLENWP